MLTQPGQGSDRRSSKAHLPSRARNSEKGLQGPIAACAERRQPGERRAGRPRLLLMCPFEPWRGELRRERIVRAERDEPVGPDPPAAFNTFLTTRLQVVKVLLPNELCGRG